MLWDNGRRTVGIIEESTRQTIVRMEFNERLKTLKKQYKLELKALSDTKAKQNRRHRFDQEKAELEKWLAEALIVKIDKDVI